MKVFLLCFLLSAAHVAADFTTAERQNFLTLTHSVVTEKVDDFDRRTSIKFIGEGLGLGDGVKLVVSASWKNDSLNPPRFLLLFTRVNQGWQWLKHHDLKALVDDELMEFDQEEITSDVLEAGRVFEAKPLHLNLEQMLRWADAEQIRVRIGVDEYFLKGTDKLPLVAVLANWIGRGGDVSSYDDLVPIIFRPSEGCLLRTW